MLISSHQLHCHQGFETRGTTLSSRDLAFVKLLQQNQDDLSPVPYTEDDNLSEVLALQRRSSDWNNEERGKRQTSPVNKCPLPSKFERI